MTRLEWFGRASLGAFLGVLIAVAWMALCFGVCYLLMGPIPKANGQGAVTVAVWTGCSQVVYVIDPDTGMARKLERRELRETTTADRPGTGQWGPWKEAYCEAPGAPSYGYGFEWPKAITAQEVERLLGKAVAQAFQAEKRATTSATFNLTGYPFRTFAVGRALEPSLWNSLPAVQRGTAQRLQRTTEDTGRILNPPPEGDPRWRDPTWRPQTEQYRYRGQPVELRKVPQTPTRAPLWEPREKRPSTLPRPKPAPVA